MFSYISGLNEYIYLIYRPTLKIISILIIENLRPVMLCKFLITDIFLTLFTDITQLTKELQIFFAIRPLDNLDRLGKCIYISLHNYKHPIVAKCAKPWELITFDIHNIYSNDIHSSWLGWAVGAATM